MEILRGDGGDGKCGWWRGEVEGRGLRGGEERWSGLVDAVSSWRGGGGMELSELAVDGRLGSGVEACLAGVGMGGGAG